MARVVKCLGQELIPGIINELYPVKSSFGGSKIFSLECAAAPYFGIKAYGVHMNGYVEKDGQEYLWIGKRSQVKPTYPGMLDHLVAGGLIILSVSDNGPPQTHTGGALSTGMSSFMDIVLAPHQKAEIEIPDVYIPKAHDGLLYWIGLPPFLLGSCTPFAYVIVWPANILLIFK
ncbi:hypothetical protein NL676_008484 [Syzygium grande]|nr:hypothetical protein NL676_008484 [Syzygium grande]